MESWYLSIQTDLRRITEGTSKLQLFYSCKEERSQNYKAAGLDHCWLKSTIAEKASDCSSVSVCVFSFFKKTHSRYVLHCKLYSQQLHRCNKAAFNTCKYNTVCPTPFLMQTCPVICPIQPYNPTATNNMKIKLATISVLYDPSEVCYHHRTAGTIWG